jgi:hypothetical protein
MLNLKYFKDILVINFTCNLFTFNYIIGFFFPTLFGKKMKLTFFYFLNLPPSILYFGIETV